MRPHGEDGTAAVEFALVFPILILLVFGIIEFGLALYYKEVLTNASREGARAGIIISSPRPTADEIKGVVVTALTNAGLPSCNASCITVTGAQGSSGDDLTVRVDYPYRFSVLANLIAGFAGNVTLSAQTVMQQE